MTRRAQTGDTDIAIIGMSAVYAGAASARALWQNVLNKVDAVTDAGPAWAEPYLDPQSRATNRIYTQKGGWLHDLARFDPREFGIMPNSVDGREPDHFLALKKAQEALDDAGYATRGFDRHRTGIVLGRGNNVNRGQVTLLGHGYFLDQMLDLVCRIRPDFTSGEIDALRAGMLAQLPALTPEMLPGIIPNVNTGIVANRLDLMGPNYIIDAACASVLVAVEHAVRELQSGRCDMMLAGGVHAQTPPQSYMIFSIINALSRDKIRPFQKGANGTLLGEGCGIVVLKRLADAERDGDRIYAVIKGLGVASDGKAKGLFAPRQEGQVLALQRAYSSCDVDPETVDLIEAHATGIALGDRTEIRSLTEIYGPRKGRLPRVAIGSVKSMISHAVPASGGASIIKTALALYHKVLPPTLCDEPAPELELERTPFYVNTETRPWVHERSTPRRAGVNAFGFGGINAHGILEEYVPRARAVQIQVPHAPSESELFLLAADSRVGLLARMQQLRARATEATPASLAELAHACATLAAAGSGANARANACAHRLALIAADHDDLERKLGKAVEKLAAADAAPFRIRGGVFYGFGAAPGKTCLLFPGEGAQYPNMLADVCVQFPQVRDWFDAVARTGADGYPRAAVVFPPPTAVDADTRKALDEKIYEMDHAAESVFAASMGMHTLLETLGLQADAMLGHSTGENTALTAARVRRYDRIEEIAGAVREVNDLFRALDESGEIVSGSLLTVGALKPAQREHLLREPGAGITVAMDNCPNQLVLFGSAQAVAPLREALTAEGAICMELPFGRAYHTPLFKPMADAYRRYFKPADFGPGHTALYSAYSVGPFPDDAQAIIEHVALQWENRVRFTETLQRLYDDGYRQFIECGPSANLTAFVADTLRGRTDVVAVATNNRRKSGIGQLQLALGELFVGGVRFNPAALFAHREVAEVALDAPHAQTLPPVLNRLMPRMRWPDEQPVPDFPHAAVEPAPSSAAPAGATRGAPDGSAASAVPTVPAVADNPRSVFLHQHFALMQDFLDSQSRVMRQFTTLASNSTPGGVAPAVAATPPASDAPDPAYPLLGAVVEHTPGRMVIERRYTLAQDGFLLDHALGSVPSARQPDLKALSVVPFTFSMEIIAEAAMRLAEQELPEAGLRVVAIEQARGSRWLSLDDGTLNLRMVAERKSAATDPEQRIAVRVFLDGGPADGKSGTLIFEGTVVCAHSYARPPVPMAWSGSEERRAVNNPDGALYSHGMFHGPRLQGVKHLRRWNEHAIEADLEAIATHDYFSFTQTPRFQLDAAMLDATGQLAGYWLTEKESWGANCFPFRIRQFQLFAPPPAAGTRVLVRGELNKVDEQVLAARFHVMDGNGHVLMAAEGWDDKLFTVPLRLYEFRLKPLQVYMTTRVEDPRLPAGVLLRRMEPFPEHFLDEGGTIWKRMLAHMVLNHAERKQFYALPASGPRREEWLMGRIAAKEAVRDWAATQGLVLASADIEIVSDEQGAPWVRCPALGSLAPPSLSISHSRREAMAAVSAQGTRIGVDVQSYHGVDGEALATGALADAERQWLAAQPDAQRQMLTIALWCAKEAAAKAAGSGLAGVPREWRVDTGSTPWRVRHGGREYVATILNDDRALLALAFDAAQLNALRSVA